MQEYDVLLFVCLVFLIVLFFYAQSRPIPGELLITNLTLLLLLDLLTMKQTNSCEHDAHCGSTTYPLRLCLIAWLSLMLGLLDSRSGC